MHGFGSETIKDLVGITRNEGAHILSHMWEHMKEDFHLSHQGHWVDHFCLVRIPGRSLSYLL